MAHLRTYARILTTFAVIAVFANHSANALGDKSYVQTHVSLHAFKLAGDHEVPPILVSDGDWPGVLRAATTFGEDLERVTGLMPALIKSSKHEWSGKDVVIIGTIGRSPLIDDLVQRHKLDVSSIAGGWETEITAVVDAPYPGVKQALVIAGADKRGTIFGIYDLSEQIGVSPWYWWADVPVRHSDTLYVTGPHTLHQPAVKYRGIFLNDEAPSLSGWSHEKFGGFNHKFYEHVFELLLRLKANLLWPAMWGSAFNEDDPLNPQLADEYGIVMGTSHHEPMMRAQQEWKLHGKGAWDYTTNAPELDSFWREGVKRNRNYEELTTIGMRGDGDMAMSPATNTTLLEHIVSNQRKILSEEVNPDVTRVPQVWALYKEVQAYYEAGMRVPDDVTLLWCDDNWGNIRRLPTPTERHRAGGAGIYYHFDYVGDPRSYKWLNTYSITKVQEQMDLAATYGADRIWIVNVGDLKPMEFPIEFFLTMARDPSAWPATRLHEYTVAWATREFGATQAEEIAQCIEDYTRYNSRRKPEMLTPNIFSFENFDEANRVQKDWDVLMSRADRILQQLPKEYRSAFFELVDFPVRASGNVANLYTDSGRNAFYAKQGWADANRFSGEGHMAEDAELTRRYHALLGKKWNHMMDQTHIGYTFWNEPPKNVAPPDVHLDVPEHGGIGVSTQVGSIDKPTLGTFISSERSEIGSTPHTFTLFNKGLAALPYTITTSAPWIRVVRYNRETKLAGEITTGGTLLQHDVLAAVVDWKHAPSANTTASITIAGAKTMPLTLSVRLVHLPESKIMKGGFVESNGYVAMEAAHTESLGSSKSMHWQELPGFGATSSGMTVFPVDSHSDLHSAASLDYRVMLYDSGKFTLQLTLAPTLNFVPGRGLRLAVSIDGGNRILIDTLAHNTDKNWAIAVGDGFRKITQPLTVASRGTHTLHIWAVDPGVVVERIVLAHEPLPYSYLGPPESAHLSTF